jgi:hypothetical protein
MPVDHSGGFSWEITLAVNGVTYLSPVSAFVRGEVDLVVIDRESVSVGGSAPLEEYP